MKEQEQFIVPGLGVVALISVLLLGTTYYSLAYLALLGLLGAGAIGSYFLPAAVQVEARVAIAALGLLVLVFMFSSLGFWLALLSFGAIGALQIRHRGILRMPPTHTLEWLKTLQAQLGGGGAKAAPSSASPGDEVAASAQPGEAVPTVASAQPARSAPTGISGSGIMGRAGVGGIGASLLGIIVLLTALMPWFGISYAFLGERETFSSWELIQELKEEDADSPISQWIAVALGALALLATASFVLPRWAPLVVGMAGLAVMIFTFIYVTFVFRLNEIPPDSGVSATFGAGFWLATLAFILMAGLQLIPRPNRS